MLTDNITVNEQSSIRIDAEKTIRFDPLNLSAETRDADIIFITHDHYDHFSEKDIRKTAKEDTVFVIPANMADALGKLGISKDKVITMKPGDVKDILGIPTEAVPAYNVMKPFHPKKNGWLGYIVTVGGERVYVCGDTDNVPEIRNVNCDIICVPIGGTYTMNAKQAAELVNEIKPKTAIPIHYGTIVGKQSDADVFIKNIADGINTVTKLSF